MNHSVNHSEALNPDQIRYRNWFTPDEIDGMFHGFWKTFEGFAFIYRRLAVYGSKSADRTLEWSMRHGHVPHHDKVPLKPVLNTSLFPEGNIQTKSLVINVNKIT